MYDPGQVHLASRSTTDEGATAPPWLQQLPAALLRVPTLPPSLEQAPLILVKTRRRLHDMVAHLHQVRACG